MGRISNFICVLVLSALVVASAAPMLAQTVTPPRWKPFGLQGVTVRSLATAPGLLCAGTQGQGIYCKNLPGGAWVFRGLAGKTVNWIWIDPTRLNVAFAATDAMGQLGQLYRSLNGATSWEPSGTGLYVYAVDGVPGTNTVYVAGGGVWRSDDLGSSWTQKYANGGQWSLEVAPSNAQDVWAGGETAIFSGYTLFSEDAGATWKTVWDSRFIGDNQTSDISAHPAIAALALTGHEGFILRTTDNGKTFQEVLNTEVRFFIDWDGANSSLVYGGGSPNGGTAQVFVSRDLGVSWTSITAEMAPRTVFRIEADQDRLGIVYAATDDGVYRFYGGGLPLCLDTQGGIDHLQLRPGACPPSLVPVIQGDAVAFDLAAWVLNSFEVDLSEVECLIDDGDIALATLDPPEPAPGQALGLLVRLPGSADYGSSSAGLPRVASFGDCP
jgi:photosystem II stability/assembly factor-like uncharacterized protein